MDLIDCLKRNNNFTDFVSAVKFDTFAFAQTGVNILADHKAIIPSYHELKLERVIFFPPNPMNIEL